VFIIGLAARPAGTRDPAGSFDQLATGSSEREALLPAVHPSSPRSHQDEGNAASLKEAAAAAIVDQQRRKFRLPIPDRLVGEFDAAEKEHLRQVARAQFVTQSPEHNERDDIGRKLGAIQRTTASIVELLATVATTKPPVAGATSL
jgi:hypothetical protein